MFVACVVAKVPVFIVVLPEYVFVADKVNVLLPNLIKLPPPDIAWAKVKLFVPLKVKFPLLAIVLPIVPTVSLS